MVRLRVNIGRRQSVLPPQLIGLVNQATHTRNIRLGRIDINTDWSDIQVEASMADRVEQSLRGFDYRGMKIRVERGASGGGNYSGRGRRGPAKNKQWKKRKG
jgi:ATP-dependent RNA helicase DeaD